MFENTRRNLGLLAGVTGVTLLLGVGAANGIVPKVGGGEADDTSLTVAATAPALDLGAQAAETSVPPTTSTTVTPTTATPPSTTATTVRAATTTTTRPAATAAAPTPPRAAAPAGPVLAARTTPTAAQVQQAIAGISSMVKLPPYIKITPAYVADFGNQVCTAFDQGRTFADVKATGLATVSTFVKVSPAAADYAVRTAVAMYCPAYQSKLV